MKKLKIYGPCQDGMFSSWQVLGPHNGFIAEFFTRKEAAEFIKQQKGVVCSYHNTAASKHNGICKYCGRN